MQHWQTGSFDIAPDKRIADFSPLAKETWSIRDGA
jgi:hypothetical protein